jgi:lambda family phage portal protein
MAAEVGAGIFDRAVDAVLGVVAPRRARMRQHRRRMANDRDYSTAFDMVARLRGYKVAEPGKNKTPWLHASDRNADGEIIPSLPAMRNRSRATRRDDSVGAGIFNTLTTNVIGTGRMPSACVSNPDGSTNSAKNDALNAVWWERCDHLSQADGGLKHAAHQALVYGKKNEDGDVLLRAVVSRPGEPVWVETIEGQRIRTPADARPADPLGRIVNGIEKDRAGVVVAYWVMKSDPGDQLSVDTVGAIPNHSTSASNFHRVLHGPGVQFVRRGVTRPGQSRGVPLLHSCLQDLLDLDLLFAAALKRTQMAACLALFIKSASADDDLLELTATDYGYELDQKLTPGLIWRLFPGESVEKIEPGLPFADLEPLFMMAARRAGASVGLSPQTILRFWDGTTYSGARTIQLDDRTTYRGDGADFDEQVLTWEWKTVQEDALMRGDTRLLAAGVTHEDLGAVEWMGDGEPWIDPMVEAQATELMLKMRLTTYQAECARQGLAWKKVLRDHLEVERYETELRAKLGMKPKADPAAPPKLKVLDGGAGDEPAVDDAAGAAA